jgi:hypothetical protein
MAGQFGLQFRLPRKSRGSFTCRKFATWDKRLYFPSEGRHAVDFFARKIRRLRPGSNPRCCVPEASMLTTRPTKPLFRDVTPNRTDVSEELDTSVTGVRKYVTCVRKVALHLGYSTYIWLSLSKLPLQCAVVSLYSVVKQRLKCNTGKVCNCLIQYNSVQTLVDITSNTLYKCTATFRTHCIN